MPNRSDNDDGNRGCIYNGRGLELWDNNVRRRRRRRWSQCNVYNLKYVHLHSADDNDDVDCGYMGTKRGLFEIATNREI